MIGDVAGPGFFLSSQHSRRLSGSQGSQAAVTPGCGGDQVVGGQYTCFTLTAVGEGGRPPERVCSHHSVCCISDLKPASVCLPSYGVPLPENFKRQMAGVSVLLYCFEESLSLCGAVSTPALDVNVGEP